jgi:dihydrofolate reductase
MNWLQNADITTTAIWAESHNRVIGVDGKIPWHSSLDLKFYAANTRGAVVIIGRNTFESLPEIALKGRVTVVITNNRDTIVECEKRINVLTAHSFADAYVTALMQITSGVRDGTLTKRHIFIGGGAAVYEEAIKANAVDTILRTVVHPSQKISGGHYIHAPAPSVYQHFDLRTSESCQDEQGNELRFELHVSPEFDTPYQRSFTSFFYRNLSTAGGLS